MSERASIMSGVSSTISPRDAAILAARAASEKQATDLRILEMTDVIVIVDYFVIASGSTERHVKTIVDEIENQLNLRGLRVIRREGERQARWILLDFGDVVVHVFASEERKYYELERLWKDAPEIAWSDASSTAADDPVSAGSRRART